ncbi:polysaccharide deacetylase family protein [Aquabacterium sp. A3]|uniref:polysaccharide deacetylase family protein n=1 Tax=Aquabacterium sp. A3 TaxID=3132829 RepID=UPI00311954BD
MMKPLLRWLSSDKLTILAFHGVPAVPDPLWPDDVGLAQLEQTLVALKGAFTFVPLSEGLQLVRAGRLPKGAAAVTFDDGYPGWCEGAAPLLERLNVHATFFVTTGQLGGAALWTERLRYALTRADVGVDLRSVHAEVGAIDGRLASRQLVFNRLTKRLKYTDQADREQLLCRIERACGVPTAGEAGALASQFTPDDVRSLHARGFGVGAHSVNHTVLSHCSPDEAWQECERSKATLEQIIGATVDGFAYPNGLPGKDFAASHVDMLRKLGYRYAVTTASGYAHTASDFLALPRFTPWGPSAWRMHGQLLRNLGHRPQPQDNLAQRPSPAEAGKRAMMVAFHFPPQSGSSGLLRTLNFTKYLPSHGWETTVLTARPSAYVRTSAELVADIPARCQVIRAGALDVARDLSFRGKYLGVMALPDRWASWCWGGVRQGWRYLNSASGATDVIWSTYPIPTAHMIASVLARWTGKPWVADFRDPMTASGDDLTGLKGWVWTRLERHVMHKADRCVFTTEAAAADHAVRYPHLRDKFRVVANGYDEEAFSQLKPQRPGVSDGTVLMLHSGGIYPEERDPSAFFGAVNALLQQGLLQRDRLCIRFRASGQEQSLKALAQAHGLADVFDAAPPIPYREAVSEMMGADVLLLFQGHQFNTQIPAKAYEYLRCGRPVLGLVDAKGQSAAFLAPFKATWLADIGTSSDIEQALRQWLAAIAAPEALCAALNDNMISIQSHSRAAQAARLAALFNELPTGR